MLKKWNLLGGEISNKEHVTKLSPVFVTVFGYRNFLHIEDL